MTAPSPDRGGRPSRAEIAIVCLVFAVHVAISLQGVAELFLAGHQGYNGAIRSGIARHYVEHGLRGTGGKPIKNTFPVTDLRNATVHWHHPPLANILVAGSFAVLGESEAAARAVPIAASLASFWLLYLLVRRRYGPAAAIAASLVFALLPMQVEYGKMVNYEPLVTCFSLLAFFGLDSVRRGNRSWAGYLALAAGICFACACDWPAYLFAGAIGVEAVARTPRKPIVTLVAWGAAAVLLVAIWTWLDPGGSGRNLAWLADFRVGSDTPNGTFEALAEKTSGRMSLFFGWTAVVTGGAWILYEAIRRRRLDPVVAVFLPATAVYLCVFRQGAVMHLFFYYYLVPAVAVAAGAGVVELARLAVGLAEIVRRRRRWPPRVEAASPVALAVVVALVWGGLFLAQQWRSLGRLRLESYRYYGEVVDGMPKGLPYALQLDSALLGELVNSLSEPDDLVLLYRGSHARSVTFSYYLWRRTQQMGSVRSLGRGDFAVVPEKRLDRQTQVRLARQYPVVRALRYLIYDLRREGDAPAARQLDFVAAEPTLWWRWLHSAVYPPYRLVENPKGARRYLDRLGLSPQLPK